MGLVETGVGLLPGGGGCKEMTLRAVDAAERGGAVAGAAPPFRDDRDGEGVDVRGGGAAARLPHAGDRITMNRERLLTDAKDLARAIADAGYGAAGAAHRYSGARRERAGHAEARRST